MSPEFWDRFMNGAMMAAGGAFGALIMAIIGWIVVQFVRSKFGNGKSKPDAPDRDCVQCHDTFGKVVREELARFREELKEEMRDERKALKDFISDVNDRLWTHVKDHV